MIRILSLLFLWMLSFSLVAQSTFSLQKLKVDHQENPLGIETASPVFSWQMQVAGSERGVYQKAYRIQVSDSHGALIWDSQQVSSDRSVGIRYQGEKLRPITAYTWSLTVWNQSDHSQTEIGKFETGWMDSPNAWKNAEWIGGDSEDLVLYAHALAVFKAGVTIQLDQESKSTRAAFLLGGNDVRLMKKNLNILQMESGRDGSYVGFELDISQVNGTEEGLALLHAYRVGYHADDQVGTPFHSMPIPQRLIHEGNKYEPHDLFLECNLGIFQVYLNGTENENKISPNDPSKPSYVAQGLNLNPMGEGGNYINFPLLGDIGFKTDSGQLATFSNLTISNYRRPGNVLFSEAESTISIFDKHPNIRAIAGRYQVGTDNKAVLALEDPSRNAPPMLRTTFTTQAKKIKKARIYATARGIYEMYLNGKRVGQDYFNPGLTQYNKNHQYQIYEVTDALESNAANAWGAWLSEGWWSGHITFSGGNWNFFGDRQSFLGTLLIEYEDGTVQEINTQPQSWKLFTDGPILNGSFFQGEVYDANKESVLTGWSLAQFDDSSWKSAQNVPLEGTTYTGPMTNGTLDYKQLTLSAQNDPTPTIIRRLKAVSMEEVRPGVFVYDMGQNMVGVPKITLSHGHQGDTVILRFAEVKYPDLPAYHPHSGMIMMENIRAALTHDIYIRKGGDEVIQPRFTFHGYRYVEITGIKNAPPLNAVEGLVISSVDSIRSSYTTSNQDVNKLWENITWSMLGNFLSIPTDTPARNERMGWSGDINVFARTSTYLGEVLPFLKRHMMAMRDLQAANGKFADVTPVGNGFGGTLWGSAGIVLPWELFLQYGDTTILEENYEAMKAYLAFLETREDKDSGVQMEGPLGDWLSPEVNKNDNTQFFTAYQAYGYGILHQVAQILGKPTEAATFQAKFASRKKFLMDTYFDARTGKSIHSGVSTQGRGGSTAPGTQKGDPIDTQASYAIPLYLEVIDGDLQEKVLANLIATLARENVDDMGILRPAYSLMTGFIATAAINEAISRYGDPVHAYRLLQQTSYPSWLYSVKNGATTIWERLNSYTVEDGFGGNNSMNSFNHYSFGAVGAWMYMYSLGIQRHPEIPGFKKFRLQPQPDPDGKMTWAKGHYDSMYGRIHSEWKRGVDSWEYKATVPPNTSAVLVLPVKDLERVSEGGKMLTEVLGITLISRENGYITMELSSGSYTFSIE
ncbi:family 78 glycoside hydrolase catalytic domain [Lunatimonas lonarensis]|nr:family 78 glycoside hydrolase catalytic domain [Lunatimonas lonarensis]